MSRRRGRTAVIGPHPLELGANHYESCRHEGAILQLPSGFWKVGVDQNDDYVIGFMETSPSGYILCPYIAPRVDLNNRAGRIKLSIHDVDASEIAPIFENYPLNKIFFKGLGAEHIRIGKI